jgi:hypothetical protein
MKSLSDENEHRIGRQDLKKLENQNNSDDDAK